MGKNYVVRGMQVKCTSGSVPGFITTNTGHGVLYKGKPLLNANDHVPKVNLPCFGVCANLQGMPCQTATLLSWMNCNNQYLIDGAPALTTDSKCVCTLGGIISFQDAGAAAGKPTDVKEEKKEKKKLPKPVYKDSTRDFTAKYEGRIRYVRINNNGSFTIGYGYDFTEKSDPGMFEKYLQKDETGKVKAKTEKKKDKNGKEFEERIEIPDEDAKKLIKEAAGKLGILKALDQFIAGKGYGNTTKELTINQNQYDALFSYFYSNGSSVFTDDTYNRWKKAKGEKEKRAEARVALRDYLINNNENYDAKQIKTLFVNSKGANVKYDYKGRREAEADLFSKE